MLSFEGVSKAFHSRLLFSPVNLTLDPGETLIVFGPNGIGKSTLLKMAATLVLPTSGSIRMKGRSTLRDARYCRSQMTYLSGDDRGFYPRLSARENLRFFASLQGQSSSKILSPMETIADEFGIRSSLDRPIQEFSSGMRQKAAILRALLIERPLLILDEPFRNLDDSSILLITHRLGALTRTGHALLVATAHKESPLEGRRLELSPERTSNV